MRYLIKLDKKGVPVPGSLVYNTSYPQKGRWIEIETLEKDEEGYCIQPPKPYNYFRKLKFYYVVDECCNPIAGSNVNAYCKPTGNYFEFFPGCLLKVCPPPLEINVNINGEIICYGGTTSYTVTATGGYPPYTGTSTYTVPAGTYTATVTDSHGTTASTQVVIPASVNSQITASIVSHTDILCNGDGDGTFTVGASGGVSPYQYAITAIDGVPVTNPIYQSSPIFSNLGPGEYQVTVMDDNECIGITAVEIYEPAILEVSLDSTDVLCYGESTGTITTTVTGGVGPYRYIWSGGSLASNSQNQNALPAGTYNVLVIDHNGCQVTAQATITQPPQLIVSGSVTNILCNGDANGAINLTVTGGVAPYEYLWSNGAVTEDLTGLDSGKYRVTVIDANNCSKKLTFSVKEPPQLVASESHISPLCFGDTNGSITLLVGGGVTPYTYAWTGPGVNPTSQNQTGLGSGIYNVTITDANGCQTSISNINLEVTQITASLSFVVTDPMTGEGTITVDGTSGGTTPYQYSLDGGPYQTSNIFTNVPPGDHTVIVQDFNECEIPLEITVELPCLCYQLSVPTDGQDLLYIDCDDAPGSVVAEETIAKCIKEIVDIGDGTATLINGGDCNIVGGCQLPIPICESTCVLIQNQADVTRTIYYKDCDGKSTSIDIDGVYGINMYHTAIVCTSDITSIDLSDGPDVYYISQGSCVNNVCTPLNCSCYVIMNNTPSLVYYSYLPCNYDVNNPLLTTNIYLQPNEVAYVCSVGIPSISSQTDHSNTIGGPSVPNVYVTPLNTLDCTLGDCDYQTSYCYIIESVDDDYVDYIYVDYDNTVQSGTVNIGEPMTVCAQPGTIIKVDGPGTLVIGTQGSNCSITGGDCITPPSPCQCYQISVPGGEEGILPLTFMPCNGGPIQTVYPGETNKYCVSSIIDYGNGTATPIVGSSCTTDLDCRSCRCYDITLNIPSTTITYNDCDNNVVTRVLQSSYPNVRLCAIENTIVPSLPGDINIVDVSDCANCPIQPPPTNNPFGISWVTTVDNPCNPTPWTINPSNLIVRYDMTDSLNCGGPCDDIQKGTATATIYTGPTPLTLSLSVTGLAELHNGGYDRLYINWDGIDVEYYKAAGGLLGCTMGAPIQQIFVPGPYTLAPNSTHILKLDFNSLDSRYHVSCFYEVTLTFT